MAVANDSNQSEINEHYNIKLLIIFEQGKIRVPSENESVLLMEDAIPILGTNNVISDPYVL
jgi:hypothetical protein